MALTLFIYGDLELNPGLRNTKSYYFSLCHWNLSSLPAHDFSKRSLIEAYNKTHGHDGTSKPMVKFCNLTITKPLSIICKN